MPIRVTAAALLVLADPPGPISGSFAGTSSASLASAAGSFAGAAGAFTLDSETGSFAGTSSFEGEVTRAGSFEGVAAFTGTISAAAALTGSFAGLADFMVSISQSVALADGGPVGVFYDPIAMSIDIDVDEVQLMLRTDDGLASAVTWSIFTDRRATDSELREAGFAPNENRGWPGDSYPEVDGDAWGSLLWLLQRALRNDETLARAVTYTQDALSWLVEDDIAESTATVARWIENTGYLELDITIKRKDGKAWRRVWNATTGQSFEMS